MVGHTENINSKRFSMNDDADSYRNTNSIPRIDAVDTLNEYSSRFNWKLNNEIILDIGCADGSVTDILRTYLPKNTKVLMGCDINEKAVEYATKLYGDKIKFTVLDIEGDIPDDLIGKFDHVFSFYTLQWIRNQTKGFTNIYNLMADDGECFFTFLAHSPLYTLFEALKDTPKWSTWLQEVDKFTSPYHHSMEPDIEVEKLLKKIGFQYIDVRSRQKRFIYKSISDYRSTVAAISPFKVPKHLQDDFLDAVMNVGEEMRIVNKENNTVTMIYNLIIVHGRK